MNIETMSVHPEARSVAINGEGYICAQEAFPALDSNISALHWHPHKSRCGGSIAYHKGPAHGIDDFTLLEPFVTAWQDAKERTLSRKAMEQAEAQGAFDDPVELAKQAEQQAQQAEQRKAEFVQTIAGEVIRQIGGNEELFRQLWGASAPPAATPAPETFREGPAPDDTRYAKLENDIAAVVDVCQRVIEDRKESNRAVAKRTDALEARISDLEHSILLFEALDDPKPTVATHKEAAELVGIGPEHDGDAEAWRRAIKAFKESGR